MKNIFKSLMLVAVAAMGFACQETNEDFAPERANEVVMTITADVDETRTYIDEANKIVKWSEGDQLKVIENSAVYRTSDAATIDADGKAQFAVSFPKNSGAVAYNAVFPASAVVEEAEVNANEVQVAVKNFQYPAEDSFDPQADVLVAKQLEFDAQPTELNMQFKRLVAMGKMTLTNLDVNAEIVKVVFATEDQPLAGRNTVNTTTGEVVSYGDVNTITLTYAEPIDTRDIYFTCNPFELVAGEIFKVTVICADNKAYVRQVEIPANGSLKFTEGNLSTFRVNMENAESVGGGKSGWNLVKDVNDIAVGDQIIIAAKSANYAISTTQNGNNRAQAAITKVDDIVTFGDEVQVLTLETGSVTDTYAFNTGSGYLYAASSSKNYLRTQDNVNANASWKIEIASTGVATIKAQGTNTNNWLRYNSSNNPPIFSCYGSGQADVVIYKNYVGGGADVPAEPSFSLSTESLEFDAEGGSEVIEVIAENNFYGAVTATTDADWLTIDNDDYTFNIVVAENEETKSRTATITFSAEGCEDIMVTVSQNPNLDAVIETTVAEFLAAEANDTTLYRLRGTITAVENTTYGNFDLTDDTGTVYIYGLMSPDGATNKYWATSEAKLGDDIEIITIRNTFNDTAQGKNAWFVELVSPGTRAFYTVDPATVDFASAGGEQDIEVFAYNTDATVTATSDNEAFAVSVNGNVVTVTAAANELEEVVTGNITIKVGDLEATIVKATLAAKPASGVVEAGSITDRLTRETTGIANNAGYDNWSGKTGDSGAVYAGNSAGRNNSIQLRATTPSGIITTTSGGKARKIVVEWNSNTTSGRTLDIYGKNTAYSAAADLYDSSTQGTKLGSIKYGTSTELTISGDYAYIGLRSNSNAMYISSIEITWETDGESETPAVPSFSLDVKELKFGAEGGEKTITVTRTNTNDDVVATSDNSVFTVNVDGDKVTVKAAANELEEDVTGNISVKVGDLEAIVVKVTLAAKPAAGEETEKTYTLQFGSSYNSKGQSSYSNSWYATCDGFIWDIVNANNNNNGWSYVKMGSKNAAYVGTITTQAAMPETIKTVTMTVDAVTATSINSIKLVVASDSSFSNNVQTISVTPATGDLKFNIPTPTANCYYKIEVDCKKASSNGPIQISKVVYTNK